MPAVKTGMTPPPMPGMPAPMQPMGGMPPAPNPFAPMPPMPLAGMPPPPMPMPQGQFVPPTAQGQGQQMMGSTAGRRRRFGDALEGMLGRSQGIGSVPQQRPLPMPPMMPQQRMVAPGTPMMRTPPMQSMTARPMAMGGEVDIFGYKGGGVVVQQNEDGTSSIVFDDKPFNYMPDYSPTVNFDTREEADAFLSRYNELSDSARKRALVQKRAAAEGFFERNPQPDNEEYNAMKESALDSFRNTQKFRDYEGGPVDSDFVKQNLLFKSGVSTDVLDPRLLKDQDFLNQLKDMGVNRIIRGGGGIGPTGIPEYDTLRIGPTGVRGFEGEELLGVYGTGSGARFSDFHNRSGYSGELLGQVFSSPVNEYNPSDFLNKITKYEDATLLGKPTVDQFMAITGLSRDEAREAVNMDGDLRNWGSILQSDDPYQAAMDAKKEFLYRYAPENPAAESVAGAGQYIYDIPEVWDETLRNYADATPAQKQLLNRGDIVRFKDVNTGDMRTEALLNPSRTDLTRLDRIKDLMGVGAIPEFDIKDYENLPNYADAFREEYGRNPTVQDFADYGYTDPEASFEGIYGAEGVDPVLSTDPAVNAGDVIGSGVSTSLYSQSPLFSSPEIGEINLPPRPADLNIFDYLSEPTYGSLPVYGMADGGSVQSYQPEGEVSAMDLRDKLLAATSGDSGTVSGSDEVSSVQPSNLESTSDAAAGEIYFEDLSPLRQQMMQDIIRRTEKNLGQTIGETAEYYDQEAVDDKTRKLNRFKRMLEGDQALSEGMLMGINMRAKDALEDNFKALFEDPSYESIYDHYSHPYSEAFDLLNIVEFNNSRDPRDWEKIMASSDPIAAARLATKQAIEAGAFSTNPRPSYMTSSGYVNPENILGRVGPVMLYRDKKGRERFRITDPSESTPIRFTDLGYTPETAMQRLQRFGYGLSQDQIDQLREIAYENYGPDSANPLSAGSGIFQVVDNITPFGQYSPELLAQNFLATGVDPNVYKNVNWMGPRAYQAAEEQKAYERMLKEQGLPLTQPSSDTPTQMGSGIASALPSTSDFDQQVSSSTPYTVSYSQSPLFSSSEIGAINLPSAPSEFDLFDYLSDPTYGSLLENQVYGMQDGGEAIPRRTNIYGVPHELSYINDEEKALLKGLGGMGTPGPGGVPQYNVFEKVKSFFSGGGGNDNSSSASTNNNDSALGKFEDSRSDLESAGYTVSDDGNAVYSSTGQVAGANWSGSGTVNSIVESNQNNSYDDNVTARVSGRSSSGSNVTPVPTGTVDFTLPPTPDNPNPPVVATIDYGSDDDDGPVIKDVTYYDDTGTTEIDAPVVTTSPAYVNPNTGSVTYTDRFGRKYRSQLEADIANQMYANQLASYGAGKVGFDRFKADAASAFPGRPREETDRMAARAYPDFVEDYSRDINIFDADVPQPLTYTGIGAIGAGPEGGGVGIKSDPLLGFDPIASQVYEPSLINADVMGAFLGGIPSLEGGPVINLNTPVSVDPDADDPRGDQIVSPTGTGTGLQSDLQRGLGNAGIIAARDADMDPFGTGTQVSLQDVKDRVARAEGTADAGGYGRLLGNQEGRFGVDLTDMTVQEVLDFQKQRGPGSYAEYSQGVNKQRGKLRADGSGVISTPAGKYQVVGDTLEDLIDKGIVDPNAKFDEGTQEKIGSYLIADRRGLNDLQAGNITREQFEENLSKEFEGIERGLDKGAGSTSTVIAAASETGKQAEVDRRDENVEKIKAQIGDQAEPTGLEAFFYDVIGSLGLGLGKGLADNLRNASRENRQSIIDQHVYALQNGATPKTDEEGNYIGFDISTMDTFADKVLGADDIMAFMPPSTEASSFTVTQDMIDSLRASGLNAQADALTVGQTLNLPAYSNPAYQADADGDGVIDSVRFDQVYGAQATAANIDPYGMSTEQGFITSDGREFFVDATGKVVEITDETVPFEVGGGQTASSALGVSDERTDGGDGTTTTTTDDTDTGHVDGVCNNPDYVYNPETDKCEPKKEEETDGDLGSPITTAITPRSFDEVLRSVVVPAPDIAPISANIRPMQGGGMAGLNRAADNFLKALAG